MQVLRREPKHKFGGAVLPGQDKDDIVGSFIDHVSDVIFVHLSTDATFAPHRRMRWVPVRRMPKERVIFITSSASALGAGESHYT